MKAVSISLQAQIQGSWTQSGLLYLFQLWLIPRKMFLIFKSDYFLSCFAGMKAQALQVKLFKYSFCLSYRAAYTPTVALPTSDVAMFFSSLRLKPRPSFQKGDVQDTSREEWLTPQWKTGLVTCTKSGKRLISFLPQIHKETNLTLSDCNKKLLL